MPEEVFLPLRAVLSLRSDKDFLDRFAGRPLMRAGREGLLRNAAIVAANTHCTAAAGELLEAASFDASPIVRFHALWALSKLYDDCPAQKKSQFAALVGRAEKDENMDIAAEARRIRMERWG